MQPSLLCLRNTIITELLKNQVVMATIIKYAPKGLVDDFQQEVYIALLEIPAEKIIELNEKKYLTGYFINLIKNIGLDRRVFTKYYFEKDVTDYVRHLDALSKKDFDLSLVSKVLSRFNKKINGSKFEKHDYLVMKKYIELKSCSKVADYFSVPKYYIEQNIRRIQSELKKEVKNGL